MTDGSTLKVPAEVSVSDRHVAAAAIVVHEYACQFSAADRTFLISDNTKHLAVAQMGALGIEVIRPGEFIDKLAAAAPQRVGQAAKQSLGDLKNPPWSKVQFLELLALHDAMGARIYLIQEWGLD